MSLMNAHRLRAPSEDGALLADPPLSSAATLLAADSARLDGWGYDFQGRRADRLRPLARRQALDRARDFLARFGLDVPAPLDPRHRGSRAALRSRARAEPGDPGSRRAHHDAQAR